MIKPGARLGIHVSEPAQFFREEGAGQCFGVVTTADANGLGIRFEKPVLVGGAAVQACRATPRYVGQSLSVLEGGAVLIVNLVPDISIPGTTHLIGGIRVVKSDDA